MTYYLHANKRGLRVVGKDKFAFDRARFDTLSEKPTDMQAISGTYEEVARHAIRLNRIQESVGRIDYLYSPEPVAEAA